MIVDVDTLERAFAAILKRAKESGYREFEIGSDYYWFVPEDERYEPRSKPENFTIGQLTFDWENTKAIANGEKPATALALRWLAEILIPIGERSLF